MIKAGYSMLLPAAFFLASAMPPGGEYNEEGKMVSLEELRITVLYDNVEPEEGFEAEWGFSCVIEGCGKTILFDTGGDGEIFMRNLSAAGFSPEDIDLVVISHEHWDHFGGLDEFLAKNGEVELYLPRSFSKEFEDGVAGRCTRIEEVGDPAEIVPGVFSTGDMDGPVREQSLAVATSGGTVVITGCAHPGIDRIVSRAFELTGKKILLVMGGFHLRGASKDRLEKIASVFEDKDLRYCGASHCTGESSIEFFAALYGERYIELGAGTVIRGSMLEAE